MTPELEKMVVKVAKEYLATKKATMSSVAEKFQISKTTVSKYLNNHLKNIDSDLWDKVQNKKSDNINRSRLNVIPKNTKKVPVRKCRLMRHLLLRRRVVQ